MSIQDTPRAERPHIGLFGRRNAGKSSLINALTGQVEQVWPSLSGTIRNCAGGATPWGTREFGVLDPDGNLIGLYERT